MAAAQQAGNLQLYEAKGELISRDAEKDKVETLYGQAQGDLAQKTAAVEAGKAKIMGGIGGLVTGGLGGLMDGKIAGSSNFGMKMQDLKTNYGA